MKRTPLKRGNKPLKRSGFKNKANTQLKRKKPVRAKTGGNKRKKLPKVKTMRNKCDKLLTPIIKAMHPHCLLREAERCSGQTEVAHHHVLKSKSTALRYELENLIPLCTSCHMLLHSHETYYSSVLVQRKGVEWFEKLEKEKQKIVKADVHFYIAHYKRLQKIADDLGI